MENALQDTQSTRKRKRLTHACKSCRDRKVRCDDQLPKCSNCTRDGGDCITFDPRNPLSNVQRREAQSRARAETGDDTTNRRHQSRPQTAASSQSPSRHFMPSPSSVISTQVGVLPYETLSDRNHDHESNPADGRDNNSSQLLPALPRFASGDSLLMITQWLDLAFARLRIDQRFSNHASFKGNSLSLSASPSVTVAQLLDSIASDQLTECVEAFLMKVSLAIPIVNESVVRAAMHDWRQANQSRNALQEPSLTTVMLLLVTAAGSILVPTVSRNLFVNSLSTTFSKLHVMISEASIHSVQTLLLLALLLRCYGDAQRSWHVMTLTVSVAHMLGLHRRSSRSVQSAPTKSDEEEINTWWAVYVVEKMLASEVGRMSTIRDFECNQRIPAYQRTTSTACCNEVFRACVELANIQSEVLEKLTLSRYIEETSTTDLRDAIKVKIETVMELDRKLLSWKDALPAHLRPSGDSVCLSDMLVGVTQLSIQYYQTELMLHRNALLLSDSVLREEVFQYIPPSERLQLRDGQKVCCNAARSLVANLNTLNDADAATIWISTHASLLATYTLAIYLLRNSQSGLARANYELQANAINMVSHHQILVGKSERPESKTLLEMLRRLQSQVYSRIARDTRILGQLIDLHASVSAPSNAQDALQSARADCTTHSMAGQSTTAAVESSATNGQAFVSPTDTGGMASFDLDGLTFIDGTLNGMDIDWDVLAQAYDLPS